MPTQKAGSARNAAATSSTASGGSAASPNPGTGADERPQGSLLARILWVQSKVHSIPKSGWNDHFKYHFVTENDLVLHIRPLLIKAGIVMSFSEELCEQVPDVKGITKKAIRFTLYNVNDSKESLSCTVYGYGQDSGDKGAYKALTGAQKYFIMKTFLIPTGDDPEQDSSDTGSDSVPDRLNGPVQVTTAARLTDLLKNKRIPESERARTKKWYDEKPRQEGSVRQAIAHLEEFIKED